MKVAQGPSECLQACTNCTDGKEAQMWTVTGLCVEHSRHTHVGSREASANTCAIFLLLGQSTAITYVQLYFITVYHCTDKTISCVHGSKRPTVFQRMNSTATQAALECHPLTDPLPDVTNNYLTSDTISCIPSLAPLSLFTRRMIGLHSPRPLLFMLALPICGAV